MKIIKIATHKVSYNFRSSFAVTRLKMHTEATAILRIDFSCYNSNLSIASQLNYCYAFGCVDHFNKCTSTTLRKLQSNESAYHFLPCEVSAGTIKQISIAFQLDFFASPPKLSAQFENCTTGDVLSLNISR